MGLFGRVLGNLMGGKFGGHHGGDQGGHHGGYGGNPGIPKVLAQVAAILATRVLNAAAPMRAMRVFASNAVHLCRLVNVPTAARNCKRAPSSAASAANFNSNAAHTPL